MKNILVCTDGSIFAENIYLYSIWLAKKLRAKIHILSVTDIRSTTVISTGNYSGSLVLGADENLLNQLVNLEHERAKLNHQKTKLVLQTANDFFEQKGIKDIQLVEKKGVFVDLLQDLEKHFDLILLGKRGENAQFAQGHLGTNVEKIIRSSHKPCLIIPENFKPITKLLLAYDGSLTCQSIISFLVNSGLIEGLELDIITVSKNRSDTVAISRLEEAKKMLTNFAIKANFTLLEGHPEKSIVQYSQDNNINMLLMGAYGHSRIRQLVIGSTTAQILRSSNIPVFVFRAGVVRKS